jgi:hypothetical protein
MEAVFSNHGVPDTIITDRDSKFTSAFWKEFMGLLGIKVNMSTAFHPQTDGQTERANRSISQVLRHYVDNRQTNWDHLLPLVEFSINNQVSSSTGFSPFYLDMGRHPKVPSMFLTESTPPSTTVGDFFDDMIKAVNVATVNLSKAQQRQSRQVNQHRLPTPSFTPGDMVYLDAANLDLKLGKHAKKFDPRWTGPFEVKGQRPDNPLAYKLLLPPGLRKLHDVFHVNLLKPACGRPSQFLDPDEVKDVSPELIDSQLEYVVEEILNHEFTITLRKVLGYKAKQRVQGIKYLVRWAASGPEHDEWLTADAMKHLAALVREYHAAHQVPFPAGIVKGAPATA